MYVSGKANWAMWFKNMVGSWNVKLFGKPMKLVIGAGGLLNIGGMCTFILQISFIITYI